MGNSGAFELVTGHGAEPHVDADDHALLYASFIGSGVYRLIGVKTAEIEVTSENEVTISPGMFLIHGRFARVKDPISLSIETGSQGQNRNDLVVCEYSYSGNETEIDDMELVVVTGTPANPGSETDPSIEDDLTLFDIEYGGSITDETIIQVPLWRVPKEGLTTQDPVALFKDYVDATTARSSIDPIIVEGSAKYDLPADGVVEVLVPIDVPVGYSKDSLIQWASGSSRGVMVNTTFNADGVIFTFVSLGAAHSDRTATATVKCRKH